MSNEWNETCIYRNWRGIWRDSPRSWYVKICISSYNYHASALSLIFCCIFPRAESFEKLESFWISLNDLGREGDLYWDSTGKALGPFNDWREGEPVLGVPDVQCTLMDKITNFDDTRRWKTHVCNFQNRYICESIPSSSKNHLLLKTADASFADEIQTDHGDQQLKRFGFRNSIYEISDVKVLYAFCVPLVANDVYWYIIHKAVHAFYIISRCWLILERLRY